MITNLLSTKSLLRQFLVFNLFIFLILGFFTFLYLLAIEPELINRKSKKHQNIIENIKSNLVNLKIEPDVNNLENFLYKSNFILDEVDQIRFFDINKKIIVDSSIIDINKRSLFTTERIETLGINETLNQDQSKLKSKNIAVNTMPFLKDINLKLNQKFFITSENKNNNLVIHTSSVINFSDEDIIITISEISNEISIAVEERKNFVLRSVLIAAIVIMIFSLFLNNYIIKPIRSLNFFAKQISYDNPKNMSKLGIEFNKRDDEIGNLSNSLSDMTNKLYQRIELAERFSSDLTHEIRNPLASLKGASDLLNLTKDEQQKDKLLKVLSNDVERIERLITDYSQVLKDEATQSRAIAKDFDLVGLI
jgi:two-component system sensor histidine kinase ChvG